MRMICGVFCDCFGNLPKAVPGERMWNDKQSEMGPMLVEELYRQRNKIIPVSGNETLRMGRCIFELLKIRNLGHPNIMSTNGAYSIFRENRRNFWA